MCTAPLSTRSPSRASLLPRFLPNFKTFVVRTATTVLLLLRVIAAGRQKTVLGLQEKHGEQTHVARHHLSTRLLRVEWPCPAMASASSSSCSTTSLMYFSTERGRRVRRISGHRHSVLIRTLTRLSRPASRFPTTTTPPSRKPQRRIPPANKPVSCAIALRASTRALWLTTSRASTNSTLAAHRLFETPCGPTPSSERSSDRDRPPEAAPRRPPTDPRRPLSLLLTLCNPRCPSPVPLTPASGSKRLAPTTLCRLRWHDRHRPRRARRGWLRNQRRPRSRRERL